MEALLAAAALGLLVAALGALLIVRSARLFDVFKPAQPTGDLQAGERSLALRLELLDEQATLTDERIDAAMQAVLRSLQAQVGARLRA